MDKINPLVTAAGDGRVVTRLPVPTAMGGPGRPGTSTPEHLSAAGFGGALDVIGRQHKVDAAGATVTAAIPIGPGVMLTVKDVAEGVRIPGPGGACKDPPPQPRPARPCGSMA